MSGLQKGESATLKLTSIDARNVSWTSTATFGADAQGRIDPSVSASTAGTYTGVSAMGLVWSMQPPASSTASAYIWGNPPYRFQLDVNVGGVSLASTTFTRSVSAHPLGQQTTSLQREGFDGVLSSPGSAQRHAAILTFGGSEGGSGPLLKGSLYAAHGYPTLVLGYFGEAGLPQSLSNIPLEYFAKALTWLQQQPGVDPARIFVDGVSRGSEAALLLGVHYPQLVHGVIAGVPSNVALCAYPGCRGAAWTFAGVPVPYTRHFDDTTPTDDPNAVIPVERIQGPVFVDCGAADTVWTSCSFAHAIISRLDANRVPFHHELEEYRNAGHAVGGLSPYEPFVRNSPEAAADEAGLADVWPKVLAFLQNESA